MDSDDSILPHMYERLVDSCERENSDIAICSILCSYEDGTTSTYTSWDASNSLHAAGSCCDKVFRRSLIGDKRFPEGLWYEDFELSAKLIMLAKNISYVDEAMYIYRCGQPSTMNNSNAAKNLNIIRVMEVLKVFAADNASNDDYEYLLINHVLLDSIKRVAAQNSKDGNAVIKELRNYVKNNIPQLFSCRSFKNESRNRKIIMALNYYGLHKLALLILKLK